MNNVQLIGRLTKDPDIRNANDTKVARFTLAVDRRFKKGEADFISCVAFGKTAEFVEKYLLHGVKVGVGGRIQTGSYQKQDGTKVYTTDVIVEEVEFCESKKDSEASHKQAVEESFTALEDDNLPFS